MDETLTREGTRAVPSPDPTIAAIERTEAILQAALSELHCERIAALDDEDHEAYRVINYCQAGVQETLGRLRGEYGA